MEVDREEIDPVDLIAPEVCVNESDPLITYDTEVDKTQTEINHNDAIQEIIDVDDESEGASNTINGVNHIVDNTENIWRPGQIPEPYSEEEQAEYPTILGERHQRVQFHRLHCTACNIHLGSAPNNQQNRYIHPLLKVLICKLCFQFYGSGDFDKDEDGSELYCRWCGQGGKVLCCAQCPCVFCQKCIRVNQGKKALDAVLQSDDWLCFVCNPKQIMQQRITCRALYDYVLKELATWRPINRPDMLELDKSLCCKGRIPSASKRKSTDGTFAVDIEKKSKKKKLCINPLSKKPTPKKSTHDDLIATQNVISWESRPEDEVVCTPDLVMIMDYEEAAEPTVVEEDEEEVNESEALSVTTPVLVNANGETSTTSKTKSLISKKNKPKPKSDAIPIKTYSGIKKLQNKNNRKTSQNILSLLPNLLPGSSYQCFNKITQATALVNQNLTSKIHSFSKDQELITTIEGLTKMHNGFQDILADVIQSLIEIKKKLRTDFITDLKHLKFVDTNKNNSESKVNQEDNDVIIIDSISTKPTIKSVPISNASSDEIVSVGSTRGYIKVKPPSELLTSSAISIQNLITSNILTEPRPRKTSKKTNDVETSINASNQEVNKIFDNIKDVGTYKSLETLAQNNLQRIKSNIPEEFLKQMATVRVVLDKKLGSNTVHSHSCKEYTPFKIIIKKNSEEEYCAKEVPPTTCQSVVNVDQQNISIREQINGID